MSRLVRLIVAASLVAGVTGCCASPYRAWQNYRGWSNPVPDGYQRVSPPRTTPPGPTSPAIGTPGSNTY